MREIKFRAWDQKNKRWLHGYKPGKEGCNIIGEIIVCGGWMGEVWADTDAYNQTIIEQYTGKKDKNGREIYEGDKVKAPFENSKRKIKYFIYPVVYTANSPLCYCDPQFTIEWWLDNTRGDYRLIPNLTECEVIGTIHDAENE